MGFATAVWLARASFYLTAGSALLLIGAIAFARAGLPGVVVLLTLTWFAVMFHGLGWYILYDRQPDETASHSVHASGASMVAFLVGLIATAATAPASWNVLFLAYAYVPSIFGPVVIAHGLQYLSRARDLRPGIAQRLVRVGSLLLFGVAAIGIGGQLAQAMVGGPATLGAAGADLALWTFFPYPAGLTALGYALAWWGWSSVAAAERPKLDPVREPHAVG